MNIHELSKQPGQVSRRARSPGINPPAIERRRLKTGWNAFGQDDWPFRAISAPFHGAWLVSPADSHLHCTCGVCTPAPDAGAGGCMCRRAVSHRGKTGTGSRDPFILAIFIHSALQRVALLHLQSSTTTFVAFHGAGCGPFLPPPNATSGRWRWRRELLEYG